MKERKDINWIQVDQSLNRVRKELIFLFNELDSFSRAQHLVRFVDYHMSTEGWDNTWSLNDMIKEYTTPRNEVKEFWGEYLNRTKVFATFTDFNNGCMNIVQDLSSDGVEAILDQTMNELEEDIRTLDNYENIEELLRQVAHLPQGKDLYVTFNEGTWMLIQRMK